MSKINDSDEIIFHLKQPLFTNIRVRLVQCWKVELYMYNTSFKIIHKYLFLFCMYTTGVEKKYSRRRHHGILTDLVGLKFAMLY